MSDLRTPWATASAISLCLAALPTQAQQTPLKMTLFGQPTVNNDSVWMAFEKGLYQQEGLDVTYRLFPSGTTAFQAFQTGQGDIVMTGDLPSVQYFFRAKGDYRTIAVMERVATAIDDAERRVRQAVPEARLIYLEPDLERPGGRRAAIT